jgi:hypothetical protein
LVWANASDLGTKGGVSRTTLGEGGSEEGDDVVTAGEDEESDDLFVSVDDEVAAKGGGLFVSGDELGGGEVSEVASVRLEREKRRKVSLGELEKRRIGLKAFLLTRTITGKAPSSRTSSCSGPSLTDQAIRAVIFDL